MQSCTTGSVDYSGDVAMTATSRHPAGINVLTADGAVRFVKQTVSLAPWKALATIAGGDVAFQE